MQEQSLEKLKLKVAGDAPPADEAAQRSGGAFQQSGEAMMLPEDHLIGQVIDGHKVIKLISAGGWGRVYLVKDSAGVGKAMKVLHTNFLLDWQKLKRFEQEGSVLSQLAHANICRVYELVIASDGQPCMFMELLKGRSVQDELDEFGTLSIDEVIDVAVAALRALSYAHSKGIVHRDIKPANIMLCQQDGTTAVKVLDFGLAKMLHEDGPSISLTETGASLGTPAYMSPEQCLGSPVDGRSDLYSLGCVMYEMITGSKPIDAQTTFEILHKRLSESPKPFKKDPGNKRLEALEMIVFKALERQLTNRYQSADSMLEDLLRLKSGEISKLHARKPKFAMPGKPLGLVGTTMLSVGFVVTTMIVIASLLHSPQQVVSVHTAPQEPQKQLTGDDLKRTVTAAQEAMGAGYPIQAARLFDQSRAMQAQLSGTQNREYVNLLVSEAVCDRQMNKLQQAIDLEQQAVSIGKTSLPHDSITAWSYFNLASDLWLSRRLKEADAAYEMATQLGKNDGTSPEALADFYKFWADGKYITHEYPRAGELLEAARNALLQSDGPVAKVRLAKIAALQGRLFETQGKKQLAAKSYGDAASQLRQLKSTPESRRDFDDTTRLIRKYDPSLL